MAVNKEYLVAVLDIRPSSSEDLKLKSVKLVADILKDKICAGKKDFVSFVLLGTEKTLNDVNEHVFPDGYNNITQYQNPQCPTWQLLLNFYKFVNEESCDEGEWLDALVVAMEVLKRGEECFKFQRSRILFFYDFNDAPNTYDMYDVIVQNIAQTEVELVVISQNIQYVDNPISGQPKVKFRDCDKGKQQLKNEDYALQLITDCSAKLYNFEEAKRCVFKITNKRPWVWNSKLTIGSEITIKISGVIYMKDESNIKLKKCWGQDDELVSREMKSFVRGTEIEPAETELIEGYMLGSTPIPFDESLKDDGERFEPGLKFVCFMKRESIPEEYFCGDSLYWLVHQKGMIASAQKLDALVRAMINTKIAMLCCKVYSIGFNTPKMVVLLPNKLHPDRPASLTMVEIAYHSQYQYFQFPLLRTPKTESTNEQIDAIDNLIDSMDLSLHSKVSDDPRDTYQPDLLPFGSLPHIYEQNVMDVLERKIISNASEDDERFAEMLEDKHFVEIFWKVPELREKNAKCAANAIKSLFPLEENVPQVPTSGKLKVKSEISNSSASTSTESNLILSFDKVSEEAPAEDFRQLVQYNVLQIRNRTERDAKFQVYAQQMRNVIWALLFESKGSVNYKKMEEALTIYRKKCYDFNSFDDYNKWIREVKEKVLQNELQDFWQNVIVKNDLGLCFVRTDSLESKRSLDKFYELHSYETAEQL
ncbi:PREDICTED: X-ray repair cross-complementing protein 5 [Rhagoletis zephyria]|uniref:X-ray repair cross-complementing protein 5 n=1 Tax=Rhagoletis zephyria TaxID=28612 RepID=UPI0008113902|nr:PREDICTED: X-ray repair cross-complementing protein 5 [Rhagoletis zephyria]